MIPYYNVSYCFPYLLVFISLALCSIPVYQKDFKTLKLTHNKAVQYYFVGMILFFFIGLRGFLFTDFVNYYPFFEECPSLWSSETEVTDFFNSPIWGPYEKGFVYFTMLIKSIFPNYFFFQCVFSTIDLIVLYKFFKMNNGQGWVFCFLIFFIFNGLPLEFNLIRNSKSIMLFLLSINYLKERKVIKYLLLNILGFFFHSSAVFYILFTPFYYLKFPRKLLLSFWCIGIVMFFLHIEWCSEILYFVSSFFPGRMSYLIKVYINTNKGIFGFSIGFLERAFTFLLMYYFAFKKGWYSERGNRIFFNCIFLYLFLYLYFTELQIVQDRIGMLFVFSYWILYPKIYFNIKTSWKAVFLSLFLIYGCLKILSGYSYNIQYWDSALNLTYDFNVRKASVEKFFKILRGE